MSLAFTPNLFLFILNIQKYSKMENNVKMCIENLSGGVILMKHGSGSILEVYNLGSEKHLKKRSF